MTLYFVDHKSSRLVKFYLWTDEGEPGMNDSHLCFLMERKTLHLGEYDGQSRVFVHKRYVNKLVPIEEFPAEEMFGDLDEYKRFEATIRLILKNI